MTLPDTLKIDVLDSAIEARSVPALVAFFDGITRFQYIYRAWRGEQMVKPPGWELYRQRWHNVFRWANDAIRRRS